MVIVPNMLAGWMITAGFIYGLIPGLDFLASLVVAACMTPTDPILAASVVGKGKFAQKHVPSHIRHLLQAESGSNDGAAFPFLYLALFLLYRGDYSIGHAVGMWIVLVVLYQIILGVIIGSLTGIVARKVLKFAKRRALIDRESMVAMYVSLALFTTAVTTLAGSDDLLAAFACGVAFAWDDWFSESIGGFFFPLDLRPAKLIYKCRGLQLLKHYRSACQLRHLHLHWCNDAIQRLQQSHHLTLPVASRLARNLHRHRAPPAGHPPPVQVHP